MTAQPGVTLLGLGPGSSGLLTLRAWRILEDAREVYLRTRRHPVVEEIPQRIELHDFDHLWSTADSPETAARETAAEIVQLGRRPGGVIYAVPGHPLADDPGAVMTLAQARAEGVPVQVVDGVSFLEAAASALKVGAVSQESIVDAYALSTAHVPTFPTGSPAWITWLTPQTAAGVQKALMGLYPADHTVRLVRVARTPHAEDLRLDQLGEAFSRSGADGISGTPASASSEELGGYFLYLPAMAAETSFEAFLEVVAHLRAPEGCPWDKEQTHQSLRGSLLEETYEALEALDANDPAGMQEEFGDLLLLILMQAQIGADEGEFNASDVIRGIHNKIVHRHPHVFGEVAAKDAKTVLRNWERLKAEERAANGKAEAGLLDGVSIQLPALVQAEQYQKRAARVGFDWPDVRGVRDKVDEEMGEVDAAETPEERAAELGDLIFAVVNLARWYKVDSESALRETNQRFRRRFSAIEKTARQQGRAIADLSLDEMEAIWQEAKKAG